MKWPPLEYLLSLALIASVLLYGCNTQPPRHTVEITAGHWIFTDTNSTCGTVYHDNDGLWASYAFEEMSLTHYYRTEQEARSFIAGWCKP